MAEIAWREEFKTGDDAVDHEHERIIELLNELLALLARNDHSLTAMSFLGEVYAKISAHFALEEATMRDVGYDEYAEHKEDHENLLDEIRDLMDAYEAGVFSEKNDAFAARIENWFVEHFKTKDARFHKHFGHH